MKNNSDKQRDMALGFLKGANDKYFSEEFLEEIYDIFLSNSENKDANYQKLLGASIAKYGDEKG